MATALGLLVDPLPIDLLSERLPRQLSLFFPCPVLSPGLESRDITVGVGPIIVSLREEAWLS